MTIYYSPSTSGFYDTRVGYGNLPNDIVEIEYSTYIDALNQQSLGNKQIIFENNTIKVVEYMLDLTWGNIRLLRNKKLSRSDWTQSKDVPDNISSQWAVYRQALRDIPQIQTDPNNIIWPTPPGE